MKKRGIRIALKGGHEFYQKGYSKGENFQENQTSSELTVPLQIPITKYPDSRRRILAMLLFERIGLNISGKASACFLTARPQNKVFQDISLSPRP